MLSDFAVVSKRLRGHSLTLCRLWPDWPTPSPRPKSERSGRLRSGSPVTGCAVWVSGEFKPRPVFVSIIWTHRTVVCGRPLLLSVVRRAESGAVAQGAGGGAGRREGRGLNIRNTRSHTRFLSKNSLRLHVHDTLYPHTCSAVAPWAQSWMRAKGRHHVTSWFPGSAPAAPAVK